MCIRLPDLSTFIAIQHFDVYTNQMRRTFQRPLMPFAVLCKDDPEMCFVQFKVSKVIV
jgi:hypothetical protein